MKKYELLEKVYKSNLPSRAKQIMFYLINRANAEGTCFPSMRTIASDCGVSERTIQRTMKVLLEEGFIIKENRYRDNGGQSSNLYKLQIEPEKIIDDQANSNEIKIKEENLKLEEQKNDNIESIESIESIEIITFNDYIEANEIKNDNLNHEKQTVFNSLVQESAQDGNCIIKSKCHPISFHHKTKKINICAVVTPSIFQCQGVGDNLYPP